MAPMQVIPSSEQFQRPSAKPLGTQGKSTIEQYQGAEGALVLGPRAKKIVSGPVFIPRGRYTDTSAPSAPSAPPRLWPRSPGNEVMTILREELELRPWFLQEWPGHYSLIEPTIGSTTGVPDVSLVARSANHIFEPGWVEFKAIDPEGFVVLEPTQRYWMRQFIKHSLRCAVVSMDREGFYIHHCREFLRGEFQPKYLLASLPILLPKITWEEAPHRDLPKMLEMVYVSAQ